MSFLVIPIMAGIIYLDQKKTSQNMKNQFGGGLNSESQSESEYHLIKMDPHNCIIIPKNNGSKKSDYINRWLASIYGDYVKDLMTKQLKILIRTQPLVDGTGDISLFIKFSEFLNELFPNSDIISIASRNLEGFKNLNSKHKSILVRQIEMIENFKSNSKINIRGVYPDILDPSCDDVKPSLIVNLVQSHLECENVPTIKFDEYDGKRGGEEGKTGLNLKSGGIFIEEKLFKKSIDPDLLKKYDLVGYDKYYLCYMKNDILIYLYLITIQKLHINEGSKILITLISAQHFYDVFKNLDAVMEEKIYNFGRLIHIDTRYSKKKVFLNKIEMDLDLWIFLPNFLPHNDFINFIKISGKLIGCTGDQSFSEVISLRKVPFYDMIKPGLFRNYKNLCLIFSNYNYKIKKLYSYMNGDRFNVESINDYKERLSKSSIENNPDGVMKTANIILEAINNQGWLDNISESILNDILESQEFIIKYYNLYNLVPGYIFRSYYHDKLKNHEMELFNKINKDISIDNFKDILLDYQSNLPTFL